MLASSDLLHLPYTPDLTEAGISYACRSLSFFAYNRMGSSPIDRLRHIVAGVAVELAFRRYLGEQAVPFDVQGAAPFTDPDSYQVTLGGHRCNVKSYRISRREQITLLRQNPSIVLQAPALVPLDEFAAEAARPDDLYLFAFLLGLEAASREDENKALSAGQPVHLIHPLPDTWARPSNWIPFDELTLKSEAAAPLTVEIGGQNADREFVTTSLELPPMARVPVEQSFYSLTCIHAHSQPEARLGLHSSVRTEAIIIAPHEWGNIWVYGLEILLTGWLSREEFRRRASLLNAGMPTFQYARTRTKNLLVPVAGLDPLGELFERVRLWEAQKV